MESISRLSWVWYGFSALYQMIDIIALIQDLQISSMSSRHAYIIQTHHTDTSLYPMNHSDMGQLSWKLNSHMYMCTILPTLQCCCWSERGSKGLGSFPAFISAHLLLVYMLVCHLKNSSVLLGDHRNLEPTKYKSLWFA